MSQRIQLVIAYDGAPFAGWQSQANGKGVQDYLESAVTKICKRRTTIHGAGRTDAGVHATGQCAHFDSEGVVLRVNEWVRALNANLPNEIRVLRAKVRKPDFHARFSAVGKIYRYRIVTSPILMPGDFRRAWHVPTPIDPALLNHALQQVVGYHDFQPFSAKRTGKPVENTRRTIQSINVTRRSAEWLIAVRGDGFLYKMVRILVGSAVRVGQGRESESWMAELLTAPNDRKSSHVAPPDGLSLYRVIYP